MSNDTDKWMLQDFDSWVDATIKSRGQSYYEYGSVTDLEQIQKNVWVAEVKGSHLYSVKVGLSDEFEIQMAACNCPYDHGPICKHMVAVLYDLRDQFFEADEHGNIKTEQTQTELDTGQTVEQEIETLISNISQDDVRGYLKEILLKERHLRSQFKIRFSKRKEAKTTTDYKEIIRDLLAHFEQPQFDDYYYDDYDGEYGDLWDGTHENYNILVDLLDEAEQYLEAGEPEKTIPICKAMIEEAEASMAYMYDSDGSIWGLIDSAFEILFKLTKSGLGEQLGKELFEYSMSNALKHLNSGGGRLNNFLDLSVLLATGRDQKEEIEQFLLKCIGKNHQEDSFSSSKNFRKERLIFKLAEFYRTQGKDNEIDELFEKNKHLSGIRVKLIEQAWEDKDVETVKILAGEGKQKSDISGYSNNQWTQWLLKAAEAESDEKKQRKYTKELMFSTRSIDWYKRLKALYDKKEWEGQYQSILKKFRKGHNAAWYAPSIIPSIYIEEKQWKKLLEFVQQYSRLDTIRKYDRWLKIHYFEELMELYRDALLKYMDNNTGRKYYRAVCEYFDRMRDLGGTEEAYELADIMKRQFSNRPAMLEEFEKAGY